MEVRAQADLDYNIILLHKTVQDKCMSEMKKQNSALKKVGGGHKDNELQRRVIESQEANSRDKIHPVSLMTLASPSSL